MMKTIKNILKNTLLILISTLITLIILEVLVRIFCNQGLYTVSQYPKQMFTSASPTQLTPNFEGDFPKSEISGHIKINSKGIRDYERPYEKKGKFRILGLGDSFTFGHGVEFKEIFLTLLEDKLQKAKGDKVEVIKAGIPGIGPQEYLSVLKNYGVKYDPDVVLVNFFVGNDIFDIKLPSAEASKSDTAKKADTVVLNSDEINGPSKVEGVNHFKDFLRRHVHLYSFVVDRTKTIPAIRHMLQKNNIANSIIGSYIIDILKKNYSDDYEKRWAEAFNCISKMKEICPNLVIVILPTREQVVPERLEKALKQLDYKKVDIDIYKPNKKLSDYCVANNIKCIDLLPEFEKSKDQLYFEIDPHFNLNGHKLAADIIYNALIKDNLIN